MLAPNVQNEGLGAFNKGRRVNFVLGLSSSKLPTFAQRRFSVKRGKLELPLNTTRRIFRRALPFGNPILPLQ